VSLLQLEGVPLWAIPLFEDVATIKEQLESIRSVCATHFPRGDSGQSTPDMNYIRRLLLVSASIGAFVGGALFTLANILLRRLE